MTAQRQLIVMRHAKAGELPGGPDVERALRPRGCKNASAAGQWLAGRGLLPDLVLCSHARRARQTWQYVSAELASLPEVNSDPRLYDADARELLEICGGSVRGERGVMCGAHTPGSAERAELLGGRPVDFPTAAIAIVGLSALWPDLADGTADGSGELLASWTPQADAG